MSLIIILDALFSSLTFRGFFNFGEVREICSNLWVQAVTLSSLLYEENLERRSEVCHFNLNSIMSEGEINLQWCLNLLELEF